MTTTLSRTLITGIAAIVCSTAAFAQAPSQPGSQPSSAAPATGSFETGSFYAGPRIWVGNLNGAVAIGGQIERGFTPAGRFGPGIISGGVGVDYYKWDRDYSVGRFDYSVIPLQIFSNYHFVIGATKKFDPYVGLAFVYSFVNASWEGSGIGSEVAENYSDIAGQAGVRYFLTEKVAVQGQVGFGYGTLGLGATWKF